MIESQKAAVRRIVASAEEGIRVHEAHKADCAERMAWARENLEAVVGPQDARRVMGLLEEVRKHSYAVLHSTGRRKGDSRTLGSQARHNLQAAVRRVTTAATH